MLTPERGAITDELNLHIAWLRNRIEAMSALPYQTSCAAYTHRRTVHAAFLNGERHEPFRAAAPAGDPGEMAEKTLAAVRVYASTIPKPHLLVWRALPAFEPLDGGGYDLYCRLAFDTDTDALADYVHTKVAAQWG